MPGQDLPHATEIAPALYAPIHQHIFCARLDFDVDGTDTVGDTVDLSEAGCRVMVDGWGLPPEPGACQTGRRRTT